MILAEKIMKLRKQNGWSQEELAVRLNISRQSVSKWESTASIPDLDNIIKLSEIFGVSTDYLLKDEIEEDAGLLETVEESTGMEQEREKVRSVSLEEANVYMDLLGQVSKKIAGGVAVCILSPILLILLSGMCEYKLVDMTENMVSGIGLTVLLIMVAGAVGTFIMFGTKLERYIYMENETLELQYGVSGIVEKKKEIFDPTYKKCITIGVILCILSVLPIMIALAFSASDMVFVYCVDILLVLVAIAVYLFVWSGMIYGGYQKLLEEGEYSREKKLTRKNTEVFAQVYWCIMVAIYLGYSFLTGKWNISWVIWPVAGVLFGALGGIVSVVRKK